MERRELVNLKNEGLKMMLLTPINMSKINLLDLIDELRFFSSVHHGDNDDIVDTLNCHSIDLILE